MADGRFALDVDVGVVIVHVETGLERVLNAPDHDGRDFDRVAAFVVDFELVAVEVSGRSEMRRFEFKGLVQ